MTFAFTLEILHTIMAVVGSIATIVGALLGVLYAIKRARDAKKDKQAEEGAAMNTRLVNFTQRLVLLERTDAEYDKRWNDFKIQLDGELRLIHGEIESITASCSHHKNISDLDNLQQKLADVIKHVETLSRTFSAFKDSVSDNYVKLESYRHDSALVGQNIDTVWQSIRDANALIGKIISK